MLNKLAYVSPTWYTCLMKTTTAREGGNQMLKLVVSKTEKTSSGAVINNRPAIFDAETSARKLAIIEGADAVIEAIKEMTGLDLEIQIITK